MSSDRARAAEADRHGSAELEQWWRRQLSAGPARTSLRAGTLTAPPADEAPEAVAPVEPVTRPAESSSPGADASQTTATASASTFPQLAGLAGDVGGALPAAGRVLAVVARPGQESAELGALLSVFSLRGTQLAIMCLTRGEASELNASAERLESVRPWELRVAASLLGASSVTVADYPDGQLGFLPPAGLAEHIARTARRVDADLLLVIDPAAVADLDTAAVARAVSLAARQAGLAVLARTVPGPGARWPVDFGEVAQQARARQRRAFAAHRSQMAGREEGLTRGSGEADVLARVLPPDSSSELVRWLVGPVVAATQTG